MADSETNFAEEYNKRFLQAVSYLIEWAKHIITIGSALMLLSIALLKDVVKQAQRPMSFVIASLLVLSFLSMLGSISLALGLVRFSATCVLTPARIIGKREELTSLQDRLKRLQWLFLVSVVLFSALALSALLSWTFGTPKPPGQ